MTFLSDLDGFVLKGLLQSSVNNAKPSLRIN